MRHIIQGKWATCFFLVINVVSVMPQCDSRAYAIKTTVGGFTLDSSTPIITLQNFDGNPFQVWKFVFTGEPGLFHIVNDDAGKLLDIVRNVEPHYAVLNYPDNSLYQQWFINSNNTIVNAATHLTLDVYANSLTPGNFVQVYEYNGNNTQKFLLQQKLLLNNKN